MKILCKEAVHLNISCMHWVYCFRLDCVRSKVWVALVGVLSAGLAVLASFGLLLFCGMPFSMTVASAPFLILGELEDWHFVITTFKLIKYMY